MHYVWFVSVAVSAVTVSFFKTAILQLHFVVVEKVKQKVLTSLFFLLLVTELPPSNRKAGYLTRRGRYVHSWQVRWFVLDAEFSSNLSYFTDDSERTKRGDIKIDSNSTVAFVPAKDDRRNVFQLITEDLRFYASADSKEVCESWISAIQRVIDFEKTAVRYKTEVDATRPALARVLNTILAVPQTLQISYWGVPNDIHTAIKMAKKETGLSDFGFGGERFMVESYDLVRRIGLHRSGAEYTSLGHYFVVQALSNRVRDRLEMVEYVRRHPQIQTIKLDSPVFVIGFPRTGTTFLHELLG